MPPAANNVIFTRLDREGAALEGAREVTVTEGGSSMVATSPSAMKSRPVARFE